MSPQLLLAAVCCWLQVGENTASPPTAPPAVQSTGKAASGQSAKNGRTIPKPDKGFGTIVGQLVWDGPVPKPKPRPVVPNAANGDDLIVNLTNKGVRNIFVYEKAKTYRSNPGKVHPDMQQPPKEPLTFSADEGRFQPRMLLVRAGREILIRNKDVTAHNVHVLTFKNHGFGLLATPNDSEGQHVTLPQAEVLPIQVRCDLQPWMKAHWLVLDHPYMALTDEDGRFTIANLPEGQHELRLWHERVGYLHKKLKHPKSGQYEIRTVGKSQKLLVTIRSQEVLDLKQIPLAPEWFSPDRPKD